MNPFSVDGPDDYTTNPFSDDAIINALEQPSTSAPAHTITDAPSTQQHSRPQAPLTTHGHNVYQAPTDAVFSTATAYDATANPNAAYGHGVSNSHLSAREAELLERERALSAREQELRQQQDQLRRHGAYPPNWPPFYPLIHHDINIDIPEDHRPTVLKIYHFWLATVGLLAFNMIAMLAILLSHPSNMGYVPGDFGVALVYLFFISAASFVTWYLPVYMAFMKNSSLYSYVFLLFHGFHIAFSGYMAVGIPSSGACGLITVLATFSDAKIVAGVIASAAFSGWVLSAFYSVYLWKIVNDYNKSSGHTLEGARNEAVAVSVRSGVAEQVVRQQYSRADGGNFA
ncbi:hypothetical protein BASA60_006913 [Batrachochytrium salamandrivorans]|nr:hypothetical protein BASA60_006913 [Batrachochytrium salamandrivorans]KAH6576458.1 hypothetical protein BASA62_001379 [Batrachochytrium salamandrivorans]